MGDADFEKLAILEAVSPVWNGRPRSTCDDNNRNIQCLSRYKESTIASISPPTPFVRISATL